MTEKPTFGKLVKELRTRAGISQQELSHRTDGYVKASHIGRIEVGELGAVRAKVDALAEALAVTADEHALLLELSGHGADGQAPSVGDRLRALEDRFDALEDLVRRHLTAAGRRRGG